MPTRAEHRRSTLLALGAAAIERFDEEGPGVTIESIADRAGLSRRTVFRYVEAKEELAFVYPTLWIDTFDAALAEHTGPATERLRNAGLAVCAEIDADPQPVKTAMLIVAEHPSLMSGYPRVFLNWVDRMAEVATPDGAAPAERVQGRLVGGAMMAMIDASLREWLLGLDDMTTLFTAGFKTIAPLIPA